jgi:hypothetical protein
VLLSLREGHATSTSADGAAAIDAAATTVNNIGARYIRLIAIIHSLAWSAEGIFARSPR